MILTVGKKVVYPTQGPCLIRSIVNRVVNDTQVMFYQLLVIGEEGGNLFVPINKVDSVGIRPMLKKSEIPRVLDQLKKAVKPVDDPRLRMRENSRLLSSGSAYDLAELVDSLTHLVETKSLSINERKTLDRAKKLLACEISEVMGETREDAEERIERALRPKSSVA